MCVSVCLSVCLCVCVCEGKREKEKLYLCVRVCVYVCACMCVHVRALVCMDDGTEIPLSDSTVDTVKGGDQCMTPY